MPITIKEFDGYDFKEGVSSMAKKCAPKKKATKEACKTKKKKK